MKPFFRISIVTATVVVFLGLFQPGQIATSEAALPANDETLPMLAEPLFVPAKITVNERFVLQASDLPP